MLITVFELFQPEGYQERLNNVCSLGHAEHQWGLKQEPSSSNHNALSKIPKVLHKYMMILNKFLLEENFRQFLPFEF